MNRRLELLGPKQPLEIVEKQMPDPPAEGLIIKVHYAGICHSDVHASDDEISIGGGQAIRQSDFHEYIYPIVLGHEISGEVSVMGKEVGKSKATFGIKVGDHVMVYPWGGCRSCGHCNAGRSSRCRRTFEYSMGFCVEGGYQQFVTVASPELVVKVPEGVPMDIACTLPCGGIAAYNAICAAKTALDEFIEALGFANILIVGAGGLGLWGIQIAKMLLHPKTKIIVAEVTESKLEDAKNAGADKTVLWDTNGSGTDNAKKVTKLVPEKIHAAVDFVNNEKSSAAVFRCLQRFGTWVMVGLYGGAVRLPLALVALEGFTIKGICYGDLCHLRSLVDIVAQGKVTLPQVCHVSMEEAQGVIDRLKEGKMKGRGVIQFVE